MIKIFFDHQYELNNKLWEYRYFKLLVSELLKDENFEIIHTINKEQSLYVLKNDSHFDIFCPTGLDNYYLKKLKYNKKLCLHINHMIYEMIGHNITENVGIISEYIKNKAEQIFLCNKIILPANVTTKQFIKLYKHFDEFTPITNKIQTTNYGISIRKDFSNNVPILKYPYILYANNRLDFTDFHLLNKTIITIADWLKTTNIKFVIIGNPLLKDTLNIINENKLNDNVIYHNINEDDDNEINNIYHNAICQICPEIIDGYAYNILEGWNNNCLTLINADNIVFNEIAGNNGMYFIFENLVEKLNVIINLELQEFADLINNQRARLVKYDINIIVNEYKKMFNKLLT